MASIISVRWKDESGLAGNIDQKEKFHYFDFGKADILLILLMLFLTALLSLFPLLQSKKTGAKVRIQVKGETFGTYPLNKDRTIRIQDKEGKRINTVRIRKGYVSMQYADCPDQLCVKMGKIHADGQSIVCLPHKVVVTVLGGEESDYDSIAN